MKLGILAVYMFDAADRPLFDTHIGQLERHTNVPYEIFCSVNRLPPDLHETVAATPRVRICDVPDTTLRGGREHAHYLEYLVQAAAASDVTHMVTLHLDSFPVRSGWAEELAGGLSEQCVFATLEGINTACLLFTPDFHRRYRPAFRVEADVMASRTFLEYQERHNPKPHSGIGYGYTAFCNGLSWTELPETLVGGDRIGRVYGDSIIHIHGVARKQPASGRLARRSASVLASIGKRALGRSARERVRTRFSAPILKLIDRPRDPATAEFERVRDEIIDDPEGYVDRLKKARAAESR